MKRTVSVRSFAAVLAVGVLLAATCSGAAVLVLTGHEGRVTSVAYSPDGTKALTGGQDDKAILWDAATGASIRTFTGHTGDVMSVAFSPDGTKVLTGSGDHTAKLWNTSTGALINTFTGHAGWVSGVAFSPDGTVVLTGAWDGTAKLWNAATGAVIRTIAVNATQEVDAVAFAPNGTQILTGSQDGLIKLWTASTGTLDRTFTGHYAIVTCLKFSADGSKILSTAWDGKLRLWNTATGAAIRIIQADSNGAFSCAFFPDETLALTGGWENPMKIWDLSTGLIKQSISGHTGSVNSVAFSPDGLKILSGSNDWTARLQNFPMGGTIVINNNRSCTNNPVVTLALTWSAAPGAVVNRMRFSSDGSHWSAWEPLAAAKSYTLPAGDGYKTVRVQFRDTLGNVSAALSDYIRLDTTAPTGSIIIDGGAATTSSQGVLLGLNWTDGAGAGVTRMRFSDDGAHWTAWENPWTTRAYNLPAGLGYRTVRVQYLDGANNYSAVYNDYIKVVAK